MDIQTRKSLTRNLSPIGAWAFALGTSIGWGSLVVTANTYLAQAGPVGSVIGLVLGAITVRARTGACASCLSGLTSECTKTKNT